MAKNVWQNLDGGQTQVQLCEQCDSTEMYRNILMVLNIYAYFCCELYVVIYIIVIEDASATNIFCIY